MNPTSGFKRIPSTRGAAVENYPGFMKRLIVELATTVLVSGGVGLAGLGLGAATVQAQPAPAPLPTDHWCPGQYVSNLIRDMQWDWNVCHDWHLVDNSQPDQFGVTHFHAEEGPEPPPPPALHFCPVPPWCP
jgi:hypothetical protein